MSKQQPKRTTHNTTVGEFVRSSPVWKLTPVDVVVYLELLALSQDKGRRMVAANKALRRHPRTIRESLERLAKAGAIKVEAALDNGQAMRVIELL